MCYYKWQINFTFYAVQYDRMTPPNRYEIGLYQRVLAVGGTPFERLSVMYTGALRICSQGLKAAKAGQVEHAAEKSKKLIAIIIRLNVSLDFTIAPDLCTNLDRLYTHLLQSFDREDIGEHPEIFEEAQQILQTLWDGFVEAEQRTGN
ncbi:MAG: flagellar export chaperone FliS [Myxococcota bacterium]